MWFVKPEVLRITIDDVQYTPPKAAMTGQELRALPNPPVAATRDLWLDVPGKDDLKIAAGQLVNLANGMVLYTAPSTLGRPNMPLLNQDINYLNEAGLT